MKLNLVTILTTALVAPIAFGGISGTGGLSVKPGYITEKLCDGEYGECHTVTYKEIPAAEMSAEKEPFCFNYPRRTDEPCLSYYDYPGSGN